MPTQLRDWLWSHSESECQDLAAEAGTTVAYLWHIARGYRKATIEMIARLHKASGGALTVEGLRPDLAEYFELSKGRKAA